ncbi:immunoglobulin kappa light chain-like, partial [Pelodiscus sinensis]|uniref:immunoglobulin kappa light chain-like n=1 Tax=Pelodiscus sinensis TaxID=13735 RepID=UPI003F6D5BA8
PVLGVQLFLYPPQLIQFVEVGDTATILCSFQKILEGGEEVFWYLRREGETLTCFKKCFNDQDVSKFVCKHEPHGTTLKINNLQRNETGVYYCAVTITSYLIFGNGSTLIVGDSYTDSSGVLLLVPFPHGRQGTGTAHLACVVQGASGPVHVSWSISGEWQEQGLTRWLKAKDGSFTFVNHISVPRDTWASGKIFTCDVKFNSSGRSVNASARYPAVSATDMARQCSNYLAPLAAAAGLLLLSVSLSLVWTLCPCIRGCLSRISAPPASQEQQAGIVYAHLAFDSRRRDGGTMQRSARGKRVKL